MYTFSEIISFDWKQNINTSPLRGSSLLPHLTQAPTRSSHSAVENKSFFDSDVPLHARILHADIEKEAALDKFERLLITDSFTRDAIIQMRTCIRSVGDETLILKRLAPELIIKYFSLLEGKNRTSPYFFPAGMDRSHLGVYLDFEINYSHQDYQRECILEFIKCPLLERRSWEEMKLDFDLGCNLTISFLRNNPVNFARLIFTAQKEDMQHFCACIDRAASDYVRNIFVHLLGKNRIQLVAKFTYAFLNNKKFSANSSLKKLNKIDKIFFSRL